ncbi:MAG: LAGLIDADG family homing endonuclease [Anaerolineae bacterium]
MTALRIEVSEEELYDLYVNQWMSTPEIASRYGCSTETIRLRLQRLEIPLRTLSESHLSKEIIAKLGDFRGGLSEKAYLIGFRIGDLRARKPSPDSPFLFLDSSSSRPEQIELIQQLFGSYGDVRVTSRPDSRSGATEYHARCLLNNTFDFLLAPLPGIPDWILDSDCHFAAFLGGYTDAEGSFHIQAGTGRQVEQGRFKIQTTDRTIVEQCHDKLAEAGITSSHVRRAIQAGHIDKRGVTARKDVWEFEVGEKGSLARLIELVSPWIRHSKRREDMERVLRNIEKRKGTAHGVF